MSRDAAYVRMLDASAGLQRNVAFILEAKAAEAEKLSCWLIRLAEADADAEAENAEYRSAMAPVHERMVDMIGSLARLNSGLSAALKETLRRHPKSGDRLADGGTFATKGGGG